MESSSTKRKTLVQPRPLNELLPSLTGLLSEDGLQTFTERKQPRAPRPQTLTADRVMKPMTFSQMRANLLALKPKSPKENYVPSSRKKDWVSSIKVDYKTISHTANGQLKNHSVRKVLNFQQPKAKASNLRSTQQPTETPKFPKPRLMPKKSVYAQARVNSVRISGICKIPDTPVETQIKAVKSRVTIANNNKENNPYQPKENGYRPKPKINVKPILPTPILKKPMLKASPPTRVNSSWKSNDASFLEKEQEIEQSQLTRAKKEVIAEKDIMLTPSSTPFKDYRSVQEYFNNSNFDNSTAYSDNTIMCFDKQSGSNQNSKREESLITSLCDLFTKATVNTDKVDTDLDGLQEMKQQAEGHIKMIESVIQMLNTVKQSHIGSLQRIDTLINDHKNSRKESESENESDKTLVGKELSETLSTSEKPTAMETSPIVSRPSSVMRPQSTISPTYKIPKKNMSTLRKKLAYKSMPNVSMSLTTPVKDFEGPALNVYLQMKKQMNFLSTPDVNRTHVEPDTPMVTSHNLQKQLDKLYNGS